MTLDRLTPVIFLRVLLFHAIMQVLSSLRRRTKSGISVWHFCHDEETNSFFALGGQDLEVKAAASRKHLRAMHENFKRYGYAKDLPPIKQTKQMLVADPWDSLLPLPLQQELAAL